MSPVDPRELRADAESGNDQPSDPEAMKRLMDTAARMVELKAELDDVSAQEKALRKQYDELRKDKVPELMRDAGLVNAAGKGTFSLSSGHKIHLQSDLHVSLRKDDKPKFFDWLRETGNQDLITEDVHYQTLRAFVREQMEAGSDLPESVEPYPYLKAIIRNP